MDQFELLLSKLTQLSTTNEPHLIAIDGIGGSGKSTLANKILEKLNGITISLDDFRSQEVYEVDRKRLINELLIPLKNKKIAYYKKWMWGENNFSDFIEVQPKGFIIFEGVTALHPEINPFYDFKIWVDSDPKISFERGLNRDKNEYGVDTQKQWIEKWIPYEQDYIEKNNPEKVADFVYKVI